MKSHDDKYEYIINSSQDFITLINRDYTYTVVNDSYCKGINKEKNEILNRSVAAVWGQDIFDAKLKRYLDKCLAGEEVHYIETFKFGLQIRYMHVSYYPYYDKGSDTATHVCVFSHDITKLGEIESKLINYEFRDPVTGLFNRRSLEIILDMELEKARRSTHEQLRVILYIGIENLTEINRRFGHNIGNLLLENAGLKVKDILRTSDYVFRYEGNELVLLLSKLARDTDAAKVAQKIYEAIVSPYNYNNFTITLECYIGIAIFPEDGDNRETILKNAITALDEAKKCGYSYQLFDESLHEKAVTKLHLERDLRNAFQKEQFELYYQPIVDSDFIIRGAEALIRWDHPEKGLILPNDFIPLATEIGLIEDIGKWALFTATGQVREWLSEYDLYVSINLVAPQFENEYLSQIITAALRKAGNLDPKHLKLEITESEGMANPEMSITKMNDIMQLGVDIYIDDFGTGLSSLNYLKYLPASSLKIDKVFVDEIENKPEELAFLETIIALAGTRGKQTIVEGVSTRKQVELLTSVGCERMQGYYFSRPVPAGQFAAYFKGGGKLPPV